MQKFNSFASNINLKAKYQVSSFVLGSLIWEPSRGVAWYRPFSSPAFSTYNGESARSVRWAEVGTHHPQSEKPPLFIRVHPHYVLAAPSATPQPRLGPICARAGPSRIRVRSCVCVRERIYTRLSLCRRRRRRRRWTLRASRRTRARPYIRS